MSNQEYSAKVKEIRNAQRYEIEPQVSPETVALEESAEALKAKARIADKDFTQGLLLFEKAPDRWADNIQEEIANALTFALLLHMEINPAQTVMAFLQDVWVGWSRIGQPLLNPYSQKFSEMLMCKARTKNFPVAKAIEKFRKNFDFYEPKSDYIQPLSFYLNQMRTEPAEIPQEEAPAPNPEPAPQQYSEPQPHPSGLPTVLFSAKVAPFAND